MRKKIWMGSTKCDICGEELTKTLIDGRTSNGSWAVMCPKCHKVHGVGLGTGKGQKYVRDTEGDFVKVEKKVKKNSQRAMMIRMAMSLGLSRDEAEMNVDDFMGM